MRIAITLFKRWLPAVLTIFTAIFLVYAGKDYPCLRGAGLALADFEAFAFSIFLGLPCLIWAIRRVLTKRVKSDTLTTEELWISRLAEISILLVSLYELLAIPVIFSIPISPLQAICR